MPAPPSKKCRIITTVWGKWHTDAFREFNLPSLLADGNVPAQARALPTEMMIFTTAEDAAAMEGEALARLRDHISVAIIILEAQTFQEPIETHVRIWREAMIPAQAEGAFVITNPPDVVWSDGSFAALGKRIKEGAAAIYSLYARVVAETFCPAMTSLRTGAALSVPARELVGVALDHFHPLQACYQRDSAHMPHHMEYLHWPIGHEGVLVRSFGANAIGLDLSRYSVNELFSIDRVDDPGAIAFINDSDEAFGASLTPLAKDRIWYFQHRTYDIDQHAQWWLEFSSPVNDLIARVPFRLHTGRCRGKAWRRAELQSAFLVNQLMQARETFHIARTLEAMGLQTALACLGTAYFGNRLRRRLPCAGPVTLFCPDEAAMGALNREELAALHRHDRADDMLSAIKRHTVAGPIPLPEKPGDMRIAAALDNSVIRVEMTANGLCVNGRKVVDVFDFHFGHRLLVIDGIL